MTKSLNADIVRLFGGVFIEPSMIPEHNHGAETHEVMAAAFDYGYVMDVDLIGKLSKLTPKQRGTVLTTIGRTLNEVAGTGLKTTPLYKDFPNHTVVPLSLRYVLWIGRAMGLNEGVLGIEFDPAKYGADPVTGFQNDTFGPDDMEVKIKLENRSRTYKTLHALSADDLRSKAVAILSNLTPMSEVEKRFVRRLLSGGDLKPADLAGIKHREKLVEIYEMVDLKTYAEMCNSVTDVLRLAAHLSGKVVKKGVYRWAPGATYANDPSLSENIRFKLSTSKAKKLVDLAEMIIAKGTTDVSTDVMRHAETWKRLAEHIRYGQYTRRAPKMYKALKGLFGGTLKSWQAEFENAAVAKKIEMASQRPGVLIRNIVALSRLAEGNKHLTVALRNACIEAFPKVPVPTLLQLYVHLTRTIDQKDRFHLLPNGKLMSSKREVERNECEPIAWALGMHLKDRLANKLPFQAESAANVAGIFLPSANRSASEAAARTSKGDRVKVDYKDGDVIRFFCHWHYSCDVDLSATAYSADLTKSSPVAYYATHQPWGKHSGDILNGRNGAAEYVDLDVAAALKAGYRYVVMTVNVYSGPPFAEFPCHAGIMHKDDRDPRHFDVADVETKLALTSKDRRNTPAIFDMLRGEMIFVDMKGDWRPGANTRNMRGDVTNEAKFFLQFAEYRPTWEDVVMFAGQTPRLDGDDEMPAVTPDAIKAKQDEFLEILAAA